MAPYFLLNGVHILQPINALHNRLLPISPGIFLIVVLLMPDTPANLEYLLFLGQKL